MKSQTHDPRADVGVARLVCASKDLRTAASVAALTAGTRTAAVPLALGKLVYCLAVLAAGWYALHFTPGQMQTLTFAALAFGNQGLLYVLRARGRFWRSRPAPILIVASLST